MRRYAVAQPSRRLMNRSLVRGELVTIVMAGGDPFVGVVEEICRDRLPIPWHIKARCAQTQKLYRGEIREFESRNQASRSFLEPTAEHEPWDYSQFLITQMPDLNLLVYSLWQARGWPTPVITLGSGQLLEAEIYLLARWQDRWRFKARSLRTASCFVGTFDLAAGSGAMDLLLP